MILGPGFFFFKSRLSKDSAISIKLSPPKGRPVRSKNKEQPHAHKQKPTVCRHSKLLKYKRKIEY